VDDTTLKQLRLEWKSGDAVRVGQAILQHLPLADQVARAGAILDVCRTRWTSVPAVDAVSELARTPRRWREGHEHFSAVRKLTLIEEKRRSNDFYYALLFVAENTAKTIYNATEPIDAFDEDAPFWLAKNALSIVRSVNDSRFEEEIWQALIGH
jgi:hypothetical protein